jgi:hypothetical protein
LDATRARIRDLTPRVIGSVLSGAARVIYGCLTMAIHDATIAAWESGFIAWAESDAAEQ